MYLNVQFTTLLLLSLVLANCHVDEEKRKWMRRRMRRNTHTKNSGGRRARRDNNTHAQRVAREHWQKDQKTRTRIREKIR